MNSQATYRTQTDLHRQLPLFFRPWWLDIAAGSWDVAIAEEEGAVQAVFPFQTERKMGLRLLRNPPLCPYLGPFFLNREADAPGQWKKEERLIDALWRQLPQRDYLQCSTPPGYQNFLPFHQKGLVNTNRLTYLIDLSDTEEAIFSRMQPRLRSYIRKAEQALTIEQQRPQDLSLMLDWHQRSFARKGTPYPFRKDLVEQIIKAAEQHQASLLQTAYDNEHRPVALLWTPYDERCGYHLLAATAPDNRINGALALLTWRAIVLLKQQGLHYYDFEGSMDKGIEQFFRKFGGIRTPYLSFEQNNSLLWQLKQLIRP